MSHKPFRFAPIAAVLLVSAVAAGVNAEPRAFTFQNAEFLDHDAGSAAALTFVAERLPAGISMREAIARTRRADAYCHAPSKSDGVVTCGYSMLARPAGGDLGEDWWLVRLTPGSDGTLKRATFTRSRVGMGG